MMIKMKCRKIIRSKMFEDQKLYLLALRSKCAKTMDRVFVSKKAIKCKLYTET